MAADWSTPALALMMLPISEILASLSAVFKPLILASVASSFCILSFCLARRDVIWVLYLFWMPGAGFMNNEMSF